MTFVAAVDAKEWTTICKCGDALVSVEPEAAVGDYAVHQTISNGRAAGPGYTITHRPSGLAIWHVRAFGDALAVARWLDEHRTVPSTLEDVTRWKQTLTPHERTRLVTQLSAIAPREWVVA